MHNVYSPGDSKVLPKTVKKEDVAAFNGKVVHEVCSTFSLARDIEWASRQFMLDMIENHEEGIGTFLSITHKNPAFVGEELIIYSKVESIRANELICNYEVKVGKKLIASGKTGQKILLKTKIDKIFSKR